MNHPSRLILMGGVAFYAVTLWLFPEATLAQFQSPKDVAQFVYQRLPSLPLENQYIRSETNKQATDSTLVSRLIQYHMSVKGRSPLYRLDWKITFADYLGVNDYLIEAAYPGHAFLKKSAMEQDRAVVQKLNHNQRNTLIQALVDGFTGSSALVDGFTGSSASGSNLSVPASVPSKPQSTPAPETYRPTLPPLAAPGGASSLKQIPRKPTASPSRGEAKFLNP